MAVPEAKLKPAMYRAMAVSKLFENIVVHSCDQVSASRFLRPLTAHDPDLSPD